MSASEQEVATERKKEDAKADWKWLWILIVPIIWAAYQWFDAERDLAQSQTRLNSVQAETEKNVAIVRSLDKKVELIKQLLHEPSVDIDLKTRAARELEDILGKYAAESERFSGIIMDAANIHRPSVNGHEFYGTLESGKFGQKGASEVVQRQSLYPNLTGDDWRYGGANGTGAIVQTLNRLQITLTWHVSGNHAQYSIDAILSEKSPGKFVFEGTWNKVGHAPGNEGHLEGEVISDDRIKIGNVTGGTIAKESNLQGLEINRKAGRSGTG